MTYWPDISLTTRTKAILLGIALGAGCGVYAALHQNIPGLYFSALATVQGSIFGVVAAIYILSRQLAATEYTSHALSTFQQEGAYVKVVSIFGTSIMIDLFSLATIEYINTNLLYRIIILSGTVGLASVSFGLLYLMRDEFLDHLNIENIEENIESGVNGRDWREEISKDTGFPFYEYFETARSAIENDDRQAAHTIFEKLTNQLNKKIIADLSDSSELPENVEDGYCNLINEFKSVGTVAAREEYIEILTPLIKWLNSIGERFSRFPSSSVADKTITSISSIHHQLIPTSQLNSIGTGIWWGYNKVLVSSAELDQEDPIRSGTYAIGDLITISSNEHDDFDVDRSRYSIVIEILISQFMDAWAHHAERNLGSLSIDDILYGDGKFMEPGEFKHNHNYFEDTLTSVTTHITSADREHPLPISGFPRICNTIIEGVAELAKTASDNGQSDLVEYYVSVAIIIAHGFTETSRSMPDTQSTFIDLYQYDDCCKNSFKNLISICKDPEEAKQLRAFSYYVGAFGHQDYDISELGEYAEELEGFVGNDD